MNNDNQEFRCGMGAHCNGDCNGAPPVCPVPPPGWHCTRSPGHDGPCAAIPSDRATEAGASAKATATTLPEPVGYLYDWDSERDRHGPLVPATNFTTSKSRQPGERNRRAVFTQEQVEAIAGARAEEARREGYEAGERDGLAKRLIGEVVAEHEVERAAQTEIKYLKGQLAAAQRTAGGDAVVRELAGYVVGSAVQNHYDTNGPDYVACACCGNEVQLRRGEPIVPLTHKDECLFVKAQALAAQPVAEAAAQAPSGPVTWTPADEHRLDTALHETFGTPAPEPIEAAAQADDGFAERFRANMIEYMKDHRAAPTAQPTLPDDERVIALVKDAIKEVGEGADTFMASLIAARKIAALRPPGALPDEMTPEMMRAVQIKSELGAYAAANLSGAYDLFREFWSVALAAAPTAQQTQAGAEPAATDGLQIAITALQDAQQYIAASRQACWAHELDQWDHYQKGIDAIDDLRARLASAGAGAPEGFALVPLEPTEAQWGGLARDIVFAWRFSKWTAAGMFEFIRSAGHDVPDWMRAMMPGSPDATISKGTCAVILYRAMIEAARQDSATTNKGEQKC